MPKVMLGEVAKEYKETIRNHHGMPVVGLEHIEPEELSLKAYDVDDEKTFSKGFKKGHILFGRRRAYLKKAAVAPFDGVCSGDIIVIEAIPEKILPELLPFIIQNDILFDYAMSKSAGGMSPRVKWKDLKEFEFDLPEMSEQRRLLDILKSAHETRAAYKEMIDAIDELVKSQFIERFGTFEKTIYSVMTLEDLCEPIKDGTHQTPKYTDDKENGFLFYSSKDVTSRYMDWDHPMYIPAELHEQLYKRIAPRKGDILLAKNGTTGVAAIVDRDEVFDIYVSLALLRPHPGNNVKYLWQAINMPETKRQFDARLKGIGVPNLHLGEIKKAKIVVPPVELQDEFAEFLEQSDKSKFELKRAINNVEHIMKTVVREGLD